MIDARLKCKVYIDKVCEKAAKVTAALTGKIANFMLIYAATILGTVLQHKIYAEKMK